MRLNRLFCWLALLTGLIVLDRSLELGPDELHDHYPQQQTSTLCADLVSPILPAPVWLAFAPVALIATGAAPVRVGRWRAILRQIFYVEPPPPPRRFRRLCVLLI